MAGQSQNTHADWPRLAEAGRGWSLEAALSSGRVRAGGRVGVSALGGSPCAQLSLVGHHCTGEECGEVHRRGAREVHARCRRGAGRRRAAQCVGWSQGAHDSARAARGRLPARWRCWSAVSRRPPLSWRTALLVLGHLHSSEAAGRCAQCAQSSKVQRTVRTARVVRAAVRAAVLTMSRCVATCCCLALDRRHSVTDCHRRHSVTDCASFRTKRTPAVRGGVQYRDVTAPVGRGDCGSGGGGGGGRRESSAGVGAGGAGKYLTVALPSGEP